MDSKPSRYRRIVDITVATFIISLLPTEALAYIDPGYGVLIVQAILSAFFGALFFARHALRRLLSRAGQLIRLRMIDKDDGG